MIANGDVVIITESFILCSVLYCSFLLGYPAMPFFTEKNKTSATILVKIDFFYLFIFSIVLAWFRFEFDFDFLVWLIIKTRFPYYFLLFKKRNKKRATL